VDGSHYEPGNRDDFDRLYRESFSRIRYTLQGILHDAAAAEDCAQEAFVRAYRSWAAWKGDAPAEAWLHRVAINTAISYRRRERLREIGETLRRLGRPRHSAPEEAESDLVRALRQLDPQEAALIMLRHHHGYTSREIAAALGMPESTISSRLVTAKTRLRKLLDQGSEAGDEPVPVHR
jgi:RNA polymerase sigma-70 factor (ECF subfamily)